MFPVMAFCGRGMERSHILDVLKLPNQDSASNWDIDGGLCGEVKISSYAAMMVSWDYQYVTRKITEENYLMQIH